MMDSLRRFVLVLFGAFCLGFMFPLSAQDEDDEYYDDDEEYYEDDEEGYDDDEEYYDDDDEYYDDDDEYYDDDDEYSSFPLKVGIGLPFTGFALGGSAVIPQSSSSDGAEVSGSGGPSILSIEPQFAVSSNLSIGLRYELFAILSVGGDVDPGLNENNKAESGLKVSAKLMQTISGGIDYYILNEGVVKPSVGIGVGFYTQTGSAEEDAFDVLSNVLGGGGEEGISERYNSIGIIPRARINLWRSVIGFSYHYTLDEEVYDYICVNIGFEIGGGI